MESSSQVLGDERQGSEEKMQSAIRRNIVGSLVLLAVLAGVAILIGSLAAAQCRAQEIMPAVRGLSVLFSIGAGVVCAVSLAGMALLIRLLRRLAD